MTGPEREDVERETHIYISSMFGLFSKQGRVKLELTELVDGKETKIEILIPPGEARRQAMYMLEAAGAAERDQALWQTARKMGMNENDAALFLKACREAYKSGDE